MATRALDRMADMITERASDLLEADVSIVDDHGTVVASSVRDLEGLSYDRPGVDMLGERLQFPVHLEGRAVEVVVSQPRGNEEMSPRLARVLVELIVNQTAVVDRLPNKTELKNKLIHDLLQGSINDGAEIMREAEILGMDLTPPRSVILIDAADYILKPARGLHDVEDGGASAGARK